VKIQVLAFDFGPIVLRGRDGDPVTAVAEAHSDRNVRVQIAERTERRQQKMRLQANRLDDRRAAAVRYSESNS
jgi:hypothetical protein